MTDDLTVRRADERDLPAILDVARRALGWTDPDPSFLRWKHLENPFGASAMWVAQQGERVVGFRAFLRWELLTPRGATVRASRAVDTATDPEFQGRGIFTRLTTEALEPLADDGVAVIFNTPNQKSLPGYLKMGWREVGRLPAAVMPSSLRSPLVVATARRPAERWPLPCSAGEAPVDVLPATGDLLASLARPDGLSTRRTPAFLAWRYGLEALGYRVVLRAPSRPEAGIAIFRRRRRGRAIEAVLCEVLVPAGDAHQARALVREVARVAGADYLIRLDDRPLTTDPFVRLPRVGPMLACRPLDGSSAPPRSEWALTMGDVELL